MAIGPLTDLHLKKLFIHHPSCDTNTLSASVTSVLWTALSLLVTY